MHHHRGTNATLVPLRLRLVPVSPEKLHPRTHHPLGMSQFDLRCEDHRHRSGHRRAPNGLTWRVTTIALQHPRRRAPSIVASVRVLPRSAAVARIRRRRHLSIIHAAFSTSAVRAILDKGIETRGTLVEKIGKPVRSRFS